MSSNIKIQKNCEFCSNEFTARTLYTRYCSKSFNKKNYKLLLLDENLKIRDSQEGIKVSPMEILKNSLQDYFEVNEAAQIMRVSRRTLYRLIETKKLKKKKLMSRTIILKDDIRSFFAKQQN